MTDCLFTAYSGARDSGPKHAGERSKSASVVRESASGGECLRVSIMFASVSARPPGFTTAPTTGARVAAMQRSTNPTATVACSSDHGAGTFFLGVSQQWATLLLPPTLLRMRTMCTSRRDDTP